MSTTSSPKGWSVWSIALPPALVFVSLMVGFGFGTACTNDGVYRTLNEPPCDVVETGALLNLGVQAAALVAAIIVAGRFREQAALPRILVALSITGFAVSLAVMASY